MRSRSRTEDAGFTLIELLISVAILGVIAVALTGTVIQYLKVTTATRTRLNESTDTQFVSAYWQNDVSSLGVRTYDSGTDPAHSHQSVWVGVADPGGCGTGVAGASPVVSFAWSTYTFAPSSPDAAWTSTTARVAYIAVPTANGDYALQRVWCGGGSLPAITIARNITSWQVQCDGGSCGSALPTSMTLTISVQDKSEVVNTGAASTGYTIALTAERRQRS